jgi:hypothetical protein
MPSVIASTGKTFKIKKAAAAAVEKGLLIFRNIIIYIRNSV